MSGHSKWSTIKHQKGATDAKKGAMFTKLANAITIAVKSHNNPLTLIEKARAANMPKEKIQHAIDKGEGKIAGAQLSEAIFEGFAPLGVAIIVETVTDNVTRTSNDLRSTFAKNGGNLGSPGSVSYLFKHLGEIEVLGEDILEKALETGALDVEDNIVYPAPADLHRVKEELSKSLKIVNAELVYRPNKETIVKLSPQDLEKVENFIETIDSLDDVQMVYCNV